MKINKPLLSNAQIWNMSFGFMGIQAGFALQNANASRILQNFGADVHHLSWFWLVAPITGLIVQPLIGHFSDKTWTKLGRRKPFFLTGAILAAFGLAFLPNAATFAFILPPLIIGAGFLMIMDASFNIAMEPFRALVADMLPSSQNTKGFSVQTVLIGIGAVIGSWLPYFLTNYMGISSETTDGETPTHVILSFYLGAILLIGTILWTINKTKEYNPTDFKKYNPIEEDNEKEEAGLGQIIKDFIKMPKKMKQLGTVQFFSWFGLFAMWVFTTPAIATHIYGETIGISNTTLYNEAGDWVGIIFGIYNGVSAIYALMLPKITTIISRKSTHTISLIAGGCGLISIYFISDPILLIIPMIGVGMAWGSILAMPYAMIASSLPAGKTGTYMGIFNFFIVAPQIITGLIGGPIIKYLFENQAIFALVIAGVSFIIAAIATTFVDDKEILPELGQN